MRPVGDVSWFRSVLWVVCSLWTLSGRPL